MQRRETQRLLTAAVAIPFALAATFLLTGIAFFVLVVVLIDWAALEYIGIVRPRAPHAPLWPLLALVPLAAAGLALALAGHLDLRPTLLAAGIAMSTGIAMLLLFSRTPVEESLASLGIFGFGIPYFALPIASLYLLQKDDPWVIFLLLVIVWLGDTAAYYTGSRFGRHRMAPVISPNKSWEGAAAGFVTSVAAAAVWEVWRLPRFDLRLLALAAATAAAAQVGDLVESMIKRGAGVKDSGHVLPGHGGVLDRLDAMLFAAPVLLLGLWLLRLGVAR
jgi:phosphatidate cytidylyltransferase